MKQLYLTGRHEWRDWLARNHTSETGVWLVFYRKATGKPSLPYEAAMEEALCFGWIDSIIKRIDETRYVRKFTPRREGSNWSALNMKRAEKMLNEGRMTGAGLASIQAAREAGQWNLDRKSRIAPDLPPEFAKALAASKKARTSFDNLAPSYRRQFIGWITNAKREETRKKRIEQSLALLEKGEKLGMK